MWFYVEQCKYADIPWRQSKEQSSARYDLLIEPAKRLDFLLDYPSTYGVWLTQALTKIEHGGPAMRAPPGTNLPSHGAWWVQVLYPFYMVLIFFNRYIFSLFLKKKIQYILLMFFYLLYLMMPYASLCDPLWFYIYCYNLLYTAISARCFNPVA